jgi:hypothetical protein
MFVELPVVHQPLVPVFQQAFQWHGRQFIERAPQ